jgi:DNA-binding NarL/FixJ family response regulator
MRGHARGESPGAFPGSVLIADDHAVLRAGLMDLLQRRLKVTRFYEAESFAQVVDLVRANDVTLALIDLLMPGLSGAKEIAKLRVLRPEARIVVLSGSDSREDILEALAAGVHGYILKTQPLDQLVDRIRYIMSGEIYVPPILAERSRVAKRARPELSERQLQVLGALVEGKSNKEIAKALNVAEGTVKAHLAALFKTLGASNRAHAAALGKRIIS